MSKRFLKSESGFVLVLSLILLPVFLTFALLIIDVTRGNNSHGDLQSAADAMALTAALELDGEPGAIAAAHDAMDQLVNNVSMLSRDTAEPQYDLSYDRNTSTDDFDVVFLTGIPADDTTPIHSVFTGPMRTNSDGDAAYVYVAARSDGLEPLFHRVLGLTDNVPVSAWAVATYNRSACQVAPVYICNPFEPGTTEPGYTGSTTSDYGMLAGFNSGVFHGRLFDLFYSSQSTSGAGNWGFLRLPDAQGASDVRDALAGNNPTCYEGLQIDTEPGNFDTAVAPGWNVRFGQYSGAMNSKSDAEIAKYYSPDINVGHEYGDNDIMLLPAHADGFANGRFGQSGMWNLDGVCRIPADPADLTMQDTVLQTYSHDYTNRVANETACEAYDPDNDSSTDDADWEPGYWEVRHGTVWDPSAHVYDDIIQQYPGMSSSARATWITNGAMPSRYDIYRYENTLGNPYPEDAPNHAVFAQSDRRESFVAVVNCNASGIQGQSDNIDLVLNMTIFVAEPSATTGGNSSLKFEITDMTGFTGSTVLDEKFRTESMLVR